MGFRWKRLLLAPEGAPSGAGGGDAAAAAGPGGAADPGSEEAGGSPAALWPADLPDHLRGKSDGETAANLWNASKGYREDLATRGTVPKDAAGYNFALDEKMAAVLPGWKDDKAIQAMLQAGVEMKVPDKVMNGLLHGFFKQAREGGLFAAPADPLADAKTLLGDQAARMTDAQIEAEWGKRSGAVGEMIDGLVRTRALDESLGDYAKVVATMPEGLKLFEALAKAMPREHGVKAGGEAPQGLTRADLQQMARDPRYDPHHPNYDPAFRRRVEDGYKALQRAS